MGIATKITGHRSLKITSAIVLATSLAGCWFDSEDETGEITPSSVEELASSSSEVEEFVAPVEIFYATGDGTFVERFKGSLEKLEKSDPVKADDVWVGMGQIIAYQGMEDRQFKFSGDFEAIDPMQSIDPASDDFLSRFHSKIENRLNKGVTFDSIIKLGAGYQENAETIYRNSLYRIMEDIAWKRDNIGHQSEKLTGLIDGIAVIEPKTYMEGGRVLADLDLINGSNLKVQSAIIVFSYQSPDGMGKPDLFKGEIQFREPLEPGLQSTIAKLELVTDTKIETMAGSLIDVNISEIALTDGSIIRSDEFTQALAISEALYQRYTNFRDEVRNLLKMSEKDFRSRL